MIGRKRAIGGGEFGAAEIRELLCMKLDGNTERTGLVEDPPYLVHREGDAFAEAVYCIDEALGMRPFKSGQDHLGNVIPVSPLVFDGRRMGAEIGGDDPHWANLLKSSGSAQHFQLRLDIEAIAGLDLDGGDTFRDQCVEPRQRGFDQSFDGERVGRLHGGDDAAAGTRNLFIGRALEAHLEFARPVAAIDDMRVAIDEAGCDPTSLKIGDLGILDQLSGQFAFRSGKENAPAFTDDGAVLDNTEPLQILPQRRQTPIAPNRTSGVCGRSGKIVPSHQLFALQNSSYMYIHNDVGRKRNLAASDFEPKQARETRMITIHTGSALLVNGWHQNVRLTLDGGKVAAVEIGVAPAADDERHEVILPAMANLHSHAFQRAMAGLAEVRGPASDSFWSWRTVMYRFALSMTPDHVEAVAAQLYMEMLEAGFSRVGEFHYLHHDKDGTPYANIAEMAERIGAASAETGIGLTLLPVFYAHSGFGGASPLESQRRFINSIDSFARLMEGCRNTVSLLPGGTLGVAPHSLRAVTKEELDRTIPFAAGGPIHIHVAEQVREVEDCIAWSGARPVEWLLANAPVDERWCFIHATHITADEIQAMARRGAIAGLCPITEANLGDGIFPAAEFLAEGGRFGIGSDSNILLSLPEELRTLEYSQRLSRRARNVIAESGQSTGRRLFDEALQGGNVALGGSSGIGVGDAADIVALNNKAVPYLSEDNLLDHWIFAGGMNVDSVWIAGRKRVEKGRHIQRDAIARRFRTAMADLLENQP